MAEEVNDIVGLDSFGDDDKDDNQNEFKDLENDMDLVGE
jgi:hypothetical protein